MKKPKKESSGASVDMAELMARVENDRELIRDLIAIFKEDFPKQLQLLQTAVQSGDARQTAAWAHTLKGMLGNLGAHDASASAARLEQLGRNGEAATFAEAFASLQRDADRLVEELDHWVSEVAG